MNASACIHDVRSVTTSGVASHNSNAITLRIECKQGAFDITLFGLEGSEAEYLDGVLHKHAPRVPVEQVSA